jgi:hypothetical protein
MIVLFSQVVFADPRDFTLENDSSSYIMHLYVSPTSSDSWVTTYLMWMCYPG